MGGIGKECEEVNQRMAQLSQRLDKVGVETRQFDIDAKDQVMMVDPPEVQALIKVNQVSQLLTPESRPAAVQERYDKAEPPPIVHILQHVRDADPNDQKACIQLYSDPSYFYQQWLNDMVAMTEIEKKKKDEKKEKGKRKKKTNEPRRLIITEEVIETHDQMIARQAGYLPMAPQKEIRERSKSLRNTGRFESLDVDMLPPVPEDIPEDIADKQDQVIHRPAPAPPNQQPQHAPPPAPVPPPPPPMSGLTRSTPTPASSAPPKSSPGGGLLDEIKGGKQLRSAPAPAPKPVDARSGLLQQIAAGKQLKKVDRTQQKEKPKAQTGMFR